MFAAKYVRFRPGVVIFPPIITHSDMANLMKEKLGEVVSAGNIRVNLEDRDYILWVGGESVSLGVKSLPEDAEEVFKLLDHQGWEYSKYL